LAGKKTGQNPTDRAKSGVKRSVLTDAKGIPISLAVAGANRHDMKLVEETLENINADQPKPTKKRKQNICMDKGYDFDEVRQIVEEFGFTAHISSRGLAHSLDKTTRHLHSNATLRMRNNNMEVYWSIRIGSKAKTIDCQ
jgi:transposase